MLCSVWSEYFLCRQMSLEKKAEIFMDCGFPACELSYEDGERLLADNASAALAGKAVRRAAENTGIAFLQGHLCMDSGLTDDDYENKFAMLRPWFDMYLEAGIPRAVLHAQCRPGQSYRTAEERRMKVLPRIAEHLKGTGLTVCIENIYGSDHAESAALVSLMKKLDSPNFGICLDTGHLNLHGETQLDFITACGKYLKALHIADNEGRRDQHLMPFGRGTVDFFSVVRGLREVGYDGIFNYEIPGERCFDLRVQTEKLKYLRRITDVLLENA